MRRYVMPDRQAFGKLRPQGRSDWRQLRVIGSYLLLVATVIVGLLTFNHHRRTELDQTWGSAVAVIEDVRTKQLTVISNHTGSAMLYDVQILAKYVANGTSQERWITVQQFPQTFAQAQVEQVRWKGNTCYVHWKPSDLDEVFADVS